QLGLARGRSSHMPDLQLCYVSACDILRLALWRSECQTNRGESLRLAVVCQGGRRVSESTIARARASTVSPKESRGADTAATIAPLRASARRIYNQVAGSGSGSRCVNQSRYTAAATQPITVLCSYYSRRSRPF